MPSLATRRQFLNRSAVAGVSLAAAWWTGPSAFASGDKDPLYKISLAQWSLNTLFFGKKLDNLDFARVAKKDLGIDAIEYVNQFFPDKAGDKDYLAEMKKRAEDHGVKSLLIMIDREGNLGDADVRKRAQAVENHFKWVEAAKFLGCHSIRVNAASSGSYLDQLFRAADGLRALTEFGAKHEISVIVENHGGLSSNGEWLSSVIRKVDHPGCGTLPDFGNFGLGGEGRYDRYLGVKQLMPYAKAVSAKSHSFDKDGNEPQTNYLRMMKIVVDAGYKGYVGIEYEGDNPGKKEGVLLTKKLLERVREKLTAAKN